MPEKRSLLATGLFAIAIAAIALAADMPGVTATEIKIGNTNPYSGPASGYSVIARLETAFFGMVNDQGGVAGRKINFISLDDVLTQASFLCAGRILEWFQAIKNQ
jgi:branched-chain amino acid transport system substrate-binding protein